MFTHKSLFTQPHAIQNSYHSNFIVFLYVGRSDIIKPHTSRTDSHWWRGNRLISSCRLWAQQKSANWIRQVRKSTLVFHCKLCKIAFFLLYNFMSLWYLIKVRKVWLGPYCNQLGLGDMAHTLSKYFFPYHTIIIFIMILMGKEIC